MIGKMSARDYVRKIKGMFDDEVNEEKVESKKISLSLGVAIFFFLVAIIAFEEFRITIIKSDLEELRFKTEMSGPND